MARTTITPDQATLDSIENQHHRFVDITTVPMTVTPSADKKIIIQSWQFKAQAGTAGVLTLTSTGVDTVVYRGIGTTVVPVQGFPYFVAMDNIPVVLTLSGMVPGTYAELLVGYIEV